MVPSPLEASPSAAASVSAPGLIVQRTTSFMYSGSTLVGRPPERRCQREPTARPIWSQTWDVDEGASAAGLGSGIPGPFLTPSMSRVLRQDQGVETQPAVVSVYFGSVATTSNSV